MAFSGARKIATIELRTDRDVARARTRVGEAMRERGARDLMVTRFVTAVSEIARNAAIHGQGGKLSIYDLPEAHLIGVECIDGGQGISDLEKAMVDGFSTRTGSMGRGLGGAKRLAHSFDISSTPGKGTAVHMTGLCTRK